MRQHRQESNMRNNTEIGGLDELISFATQRQHYTVMLDVATLRIIGTNTQFLEDCSAHVGSLNGRTLQEAGIFLTDEEILPTLVFEPQAWKRSTQTEARITCLKNGTQVFSVQVNYIHATPPSLVLTIQPKQVDHYRGLLHKLQSYQEAINLSSLVSITDTYGDIIFVNERFCEISKYSKDELLGQNHRILKSDYHGRDFYKNMWDCISSGKPWRGEIKNRAKDGSFYWVDSVITPVFDEHKNIVQYLSIRNVITEKKESENFRNSVLSTLKVRLVVLNSAGCIVYANDDWKEFAKNNYGIDLENSYEFNYLKFSQQNVYRDSDQIILSKLKAILAGADETLSTQYDIDTPEGLRCFEMRITPFIGGGAVLAHYDITSQKIYEKEILDSKEQLLLAQKIANYGTWQLDLKKNTLVWSEQNYKIFGIAPETEMNYTSFLALVHPDDRKMVDQKWKAALQGEEYNIVHRIITPRGELKWVREIAKLDFDKNHNISLGIGTTHDITDRENARQKLLQNLQDITKKEHLLTLSAQVAKLGFWEMDPQTGKVKFTPELLGIYETKDVSSIEQALSQVLEEDRPIVEVGFCNLNTGVYKPFTYRIQTASGAIKWLQTTPSGSKWDDGNKIVFGTTQDISELKSYQEEQERSLTELSDRYNELMQFSYIVSHNLRSPIVNIMGLAQIMDSGEQSEEEKKEIEKLISQAAHKLEVLTRDLSEIVSMRSTIHKNKENISISNTIRNICSTIHTEIAATNATITTDIDENADVLFGISSYMNSIFYNLISNALKYRSDKRPPEIHISTQKLRNEIVITVKDNGIGMDMDSNGDRVFHIYQRFNTHTEGKGLGLYMTKTQVESLGGKITVNSAPDQGCEFKITFKQVANSETIVHSN